MKKLFKLFLILSTFIFSFTLIGCAPKGEASQVLNDYYQNIKDANIEGAYDKLSEASKKNFTKEDFIKWQSMMKETSTLKDCKVDKSNEYKNKELDGIKFKNVVEFNVVEKTQNLYDNKEEAHNYKRNVVNDNGIWKVYRGKENGKELVARESTALAWMYIDGKGKTRNLNEAATILNESLKQNKEFSGTYYGLARVYVELRRYDEAIDSANQFLSRAKENKDKSNGYNILGVIYQNKEQLDKAREFFNKALELDKDNEYAKTNLQNLK